MSLETRLLAFAQAVGIDIKGLNTKVAAFINDAAAASTSTYSSTKITALIAAAVASGVQINDTTASTTSVYSSSKTAALIAAATAGAVTINDTTASGTSTYSSNKINSSITAAVAAVVGAAPAALDTLVEIAAQLVADESGAAALTTAVGNRVRFDAAQTLTAPQAVQARANIGAQDAANIGNADADVLAAYSAAKL